MRILVVEDELLISECIRVRLERENYLVDVAGDGDQALALAREQTYDLVILDLMLPRRDGLSVCQALRAARQTMPVLMLTNLGTLEDRVRGLDCGADDYLPKPFEYAELLARVRALLRRDKVNKVRLIVIADLEIDVAGRTVRRGSQELHLTRREFDLLVALASNEGRTVSREMILERVWHNDDSLSDTISFHVNGLRRKLDADFETKLLHTVHGVGYVLRAPD